MQVERERRVGQPVAVGRCATAAPDCATPALGVTWCRKRLSCGGSSGASSLIVSGADRGDVDGRAERDLLDDAVVEQVARAPRSPRRWRAVSSRRASARRAPARAGSRRARSRRRAARSRAQRVAVAVPRRARTSMRSIVTCTTVRPIALRRPRASGRAATADPARRRRCTVACHATRSRCWHRGARRLASLARQHRSARRSADRDVRGRRAHALLCHGAAIACRWGDAREADARDRPRRELGGRGTAGSRRCVAFATRPGRRERRGGCASHAAGPAIRWHRSLRGLASLSGSLRARRRRMRPSSSASGSSDRGARRVRRRSSRREIAKELRSSALSGRHHAAGTRRAAPA